MLACLKCLLFSTGRISEAHHLIRERVAAVQGVNVLTKFDGKDMAQASRAIEDGLVLVTAVSYTR